MRPRGLVVAIDGPSGAGKSTAGRALARRLGYAFIDTGAMYRALAWKAIEAGADVDSEAEVAELARSMAFEFVGESGVRLDGVDVTDRIRTREVSVAASRVSRHPAVRRALVERQRELGRAGGVVLDGRDIGTAVFPDAELKFFVDADPRRRAARRHAELKARGVEADLEAIERDTVERDRADRTRADSPLVRAPDAVLLDTTALAPEQVVERMEVEASARRASLTT
jgi:cytidylate kinase